MEFHKLANIFPLIGEADLAVLAEDIKENGQISAIWLHQDGSILDGRNRYLACIKAGVEPRFRKYEGDDPLKFVVSTNLNRRHLNESQRGMVATEIANMENGGDRGANQHGIRQSANLHSGKVSIAQAAEMLNVSPRTVKAAKKVKDGGNPSLIDAVNSGRVSVSAASHIADLPKEEQAIVVTLTEKGINEAAKRIKKKKSEENARARAEIMSRQVVLPHGKFQTIVIDPPWQMQKIDRAVAPDQVGFDYPTMTIDEIKAFDVPSMAADNCHIYCWTTQKYLRHTFGIIEAWGFNPIVTMVWHKNGGFQPFGLPQYNCEFVIFGRKGNLQFTETKAFPTCFSAPRREHSRKPDEFYEMVARVSPCPRIDVFSREKRHGFDQFGNEAEKYV